MDCHSQHLGLEVSVHVSYAPEQDFSELYRQALTNYFISQLKYFIDDTFAQYYYQSRHIASPRPSPPASPYPEVVLEIPSDSESSRRPSQFSTSLSTSSFSGRRRASHCGELSSASLLGVPTSRQRGDSLPGASLSSPSLPSIS